MHLEHFFRELFRLHVHASPSVGIRLHVGNVDEKSSQVDLALNGERVVVAASGLFVRTAEHLQQVLMPLTLLGQIQSFFVGHDIFNLVIFVVVSAFFICQASKNQCHGEHRPDQSVTDSPHFSVVDLPKYGGDSFSET
eukprot:13319_1